MLSAIIVGFERLEIYRFCKIYYLHHCPKQRCHSVRWIGFSVWLTMKLNMRVFDGTLQSWYSRILVRRQLSVTTSFPWEHTDIHANLHTVVNNYATHSLGGSNTHCTPARSCSYVHLSACVRCRVLNSREKSSTLSPKLTGKLYHV